MACNRGTGRQKQQDRIGQATGPGNSSTLRPPLGSSRQPACHLSPTLFQEPHPGIQFPPLHPCQRGAGDSDDLDEGSAGLCCRFKHIESFLQGTGELIPSPLLQSAVLPGTLSFPLRSPGYRLARFCSGIRQRTSRRRPRGDLCSPSMPKWAAIQGRVAQRPAWRPLRMALRLP